MSIKGELEVRCPNGCPPFETEVFTFIRGDAEPEMRECVRAKECNLLLCPACEKPFYAEVPYVYFEPGAELLAFVFPVCYEKRAAHWRRKMREDFAQMKAALGRGMPVDTEPVIFFGADGLADLLAREDFLGVETEVMEAVAKELGLGLYRVRPSAARAGDFPRVLPYAAEEGATPKGVVAGLDRVLGANDRLESFRAYRGVIARRGARMPPGRQPS